MTQRKPPSVTIFDVAKRAGISTATVSRVLNTPELVAPETVARVQAVMAELKYAPQAAARNLATRKNNTIGLVLEDISGDFFAPLLRGIENATRQAGYGLLVASAGQAGPQDELPRTLAAQNADGLLVFAASLSEPALRHCYEAGTPLVLIHQTPPEKMDIPCVTVENKAAAFRLVDHLIGVHGCRRIVFLSGPAGQEDSRWRELGYREALAAHGIPFDPDLLAPGEFDRTVAAASTRSLLAAGIHFDAIFPGDDEAVIGVLEVLRAAGRRVPEDVAVVGFDDQMLSAYLNPPLTTVRAPTEQVGYEAVQQLLKLLQTGQADALTLLPTEMIIRRSCGCRPRLS